MARDEFSTRVADFNQAQIDAIETAVTAIQDTDLVDLNAKVDSLESGFTPKNRTPSIVGLYGASSTYQTVKEVLAGAGFFKLNVLSFAQQNTVSYTNIYLKIVIDGVTIYDGMVNRYASSNFNTSGVIFCDLFSYQNSFSVSIRCGPPNNSYEINIIDYAE